VGNTTEEVTMSVTEFFSYLLGRKASRPLALQLVEAYERKAKS
jgi:hypothetical protein